MSLTRIEKLIRKVKRKNIRVSNRVKNKISDKGLELDIVLDHLKNGEYEGIVKQEEGEYIIITAYDGNHDLITIIRIDGEYINIKTSFPQNKKRRFKRGWR